MTAAAEFAAVGDDESAGAALADAAALADVAAAAESTAAADALGAALAAAEAEGASMPPWSSGTLDFEHAKNEIERRANERKEFGSRIVRRSIGENATVRAR